MDEESQPQKAKHEITGLYSYSAVIPNEVRNPEQPGQRKSLFFEAWPADSARLHQIQLNLF